MRLDGLLPSHKTQDESSFSAFYSLTSPCNIDVTVAFATRLLIISFLISQIPEQDDVGEVLAEGCGEPIVEYWGQNPAKHYDSDDNHDSDNIVLPQFNPSLGD